MINPEKKLSGIMVPVFALRGKEDFGIGDTAAVAEAIDFCCRHGVSVLQVLPINETSGDNSPYNAISSVALDPVLLNVTPQAIPDLSVESFERLAPKELLCQLSQGSVDYRRVKLLKLDLLQAAYEKFRREEISRKSARFLSFEKWQADEASWLPAYTLFRTLIDLNQGNVRWTEWAPEMQTFEGALQWLSAYAGQSEIEERRQFFAYVQWLAFGQWKSVRSLAQTRSVALMGDMPFGVSRYSADVWAQQELFDRQWCGGAPPETFFKDDLFTAQWGQNWGIPLYCWEEHRKEDFAWWRTRIRKITEIFHYFRIDHVLGFFRIYSFPWLPERNQEFVNLTPEQAAALAGGKLPQFLPRSDDEPEDAEANCKEGRALLQMILDEAGISGVVAEDLGVVPVYVRPLLKELGIPGFTIPFWECNEDDRSLTPREKLPALSLATYATHDHLPLVLIWEDMVARWHGADGHAAWLEVQHLMRFLKLDEESPPKLFTKELHFAMMKALLESPCWLAVFMITDLLATSERFNQPGLAADSNWSQRLEQPLSFYQNSSPFKERLAEFARLSRENGRLPEAAATAGTIL